MAQEWQFFEEYSYLSATPGTEIDCNCHGAGLIEIKWPATLISKIPSTENYSKLIGKVKAKIYMSLLQADSRATWWNWPFILWFVCFFISRKFYNSCEI